MKPALIKATGLCLAFPDTCHIPAPPPPAGPGGIPTPFPNIGDISSTDKCTKKVLFNKKGVLVKGSKIPRSQGDEAGCSNLPTPKGLMSQKNMGAGEVPRLQRQGEGGRTKASCRCWRRRSTTAAAPTTSPWARRWCLLRSRSW